jgi:hypothetical protein
MKNAKPDNTADTRGKDPNTNSEGINPSAPTTGTEAYGGTADERRVLGKKNEYDAAAAHRSDRLRV